MSDHKLLHQSVPGAEAVEAATASSTGPAAPVPLPVVRRTDDDVERAAARLRAARGRGNAGPGELDNLANYKLAPDQQVPKADGSKPDEYAGTPSGKFSPESSATKRAGVAAVKEGEAPDKKALHQPVADLGEIYAHCSMLEAEFKYQVEQVAAKSKGKTQFRPGGKMKSLDRTMEKVTADYKGDMSRIVDLTGGSISFDDPKDLVKCYGTIAKNPMFHLVRVKNSLVNGKGYGDINLSIEMGGADIDIYDARGKVTGKEHYAGFVIELQLHLAPIIGVKEAAHKQYEKMRTLDADNKVAGKKEDRSDWSPEDRTAYEDLLSEMEGLYGKAWETLGSTKALNRKLKVIKPMSPT
ncbi:hypothetical protein ASC77_06090 [Nocardioides sp. Root1257]|uniref:hypothetical protein n=1 Tax=unclassified Nocardioides TaxID=2615069 RepID=UPI000700B2D4|nr:MULTISPECIES: hypothetical protein [unclassified Nocardioides]KQW48330.1 hypothetical protein ASC77_06090 [Nocardioides sp. Root1257]KRC47504.1 hypothetical protein ASE24_06090 [Nocardioides sp. Root224]